MTTSWLFTSHQTSFRILCAQCRAGTHTSSSGISASSSEDKRTAGQVHFLKDVEVLQERVQKRATKCVKGMKSNKYLERLHILRLTTLKRRKIRGDLILILSGKENVDSEIFLQLADSSRHTRCHSLKLYKRHCRLHSRKFFFSRELLAAGILCHNTSYIGTIAQLLQESAG